MWAIAPRQWPEAQGFASSERSYARAGDVSATRDVGRMSSRPDAYLRSTTATNGLERFVKVSDGVQRSLSNPHDYTTGPGSTRTVLTPCRRQQSGADRKGLQQCPEVVPDCHEATLTFRPSRAKMVAQCKAKLDPFGVG
jgi:hypothetical protein